MIVLQPSLALVAGAISADCGNTSLISGTLARSGGVPRKIYNCYTLEDMRKWLAIFLLVLMPLQLSWAAVTSYCQHETGASAKHFGHHDHQHKAADGKETAPDTAKIGGGDPDCASCHAGCSSALPVEMTLPTMFTSSLGIADYWARLTSPPFERLERPQWRVLA